MQKKTSGLLHLVASFLLAGTMVMSAQAQSSNNRQHSAALDNARTAIIQAIGPEKDTVDIVTTGNLVTVERVNSNMNGSSHGARNNEAAVIGPIVVQAIAEKPEFKGVVVIRVQYVSRASSASKHKVLDTIEFRKDASGNFQFHQT
jgi:hypothetical protein